MGCCCLFLLASFIQTLVFGKLQLVEQQVLCQWYSRWYPVGSLSSLHNLYNVFLSHSPFTAHEGQVLELCVLQVHICVWCAERAGDA